MRVNLREYWALTQRIARSFRAQALPLVQQTNLIAPKREGRISPEVAQELKDLVSAYRLKSYQAGVQLLTQEANKLDADPLIMPLAPYRKDWFEGALKLKSQKDLLNRLETHVRTAGRRAISQTIPDPMAGATTDNVLYEEAQPYDPEQLEDSDQETSQVTGPTGRRLIYPVACARVLSGPQNCGFCVMLASRGPIYSSASKAGAKGVKGTGSTWTPSSQYPNSFHDSCDCLVVPVYDPEGEWLGKEQAQTLYDLWSEVTDNSGITKIDTYEGSRDLKKAFEQHLAEMEEKGEVLDVEDLHTDQAQETAGLETPQISEQNPNPATAEPISPELKELGAEELQAAENYLTETVTETIDAQDLPVFEEIKGLTSPAFKRFSWHGVGKNKGGHSPDSTFKGKSRMPQGTTFEEFVQVTLDTVKEPDYLSIENKHYSFTKTIKLVSGLYIIFQVKIHIESGKVSHAYPVVGQGVTVYNPKQETPTPVFFRPGVLGEELKRVRR